MLLAKSRVIMRILIMSGKRKLRSLKEFVVYSSLKVSLVATSSTKS